MTSIQQALEGYLLDKMAKLCAHGAVSTDANSQASQAIDDLALFEMITPFERIASALGPGIVGPKRVVEDAPQSLRVSRQHRYSLSQWPSFEFVIFESDDGLAWGQRFARRRDVLAPIIREVSDLTRWSHLESEVRGALGAPKGHESWSPWETSIYRFDDVDFALCFVYGLLQSVMPVGSGTTGERG